MTESGDDLVRRLHWDEVERVRKQGLSAAIPESSTVHFTELPEAKVDSPLCQEWNTYRREVGQLLAAGNSGRHVLIKNDRIIGIWDTYDDAMREAYHRLPDQPFLVHQIQERERVLRCLNVRSWPSQFSGLHLTS